MEQNTSDVSPYLIKSLTLDDNCLSDEDLANLLEGVSKQGHLLHFSYNQNEFGKQSADALIELINYQHDQSMRRYSCHNPLLESIRFNKIKL